MLFNSLKLMGYEIFNDDIRNIKISTINRKFIINTLNPHSFIISKKDKKFNSALKNSDILLPDGSGIVLASKLLKNKNIRKIAGYDIHEHLLNELNKTKGKCFYLGSNINTLQKIQERINKEYPHIETASFSPPYKTNFSQIENNYIINKINNFAPDILFVGMTAPKQEKWVYENYKKIDAKIFCSIGAVFDFYAGTVKRPSDIWISLHLEWLSRFLKEPKRLWKRNFISTPLFLINIFIYKLNFNDSFYKLSLKESIDEK